MSRRDVLFVASCAAISAAVLSVMLARPVFGGPHATVSTLSGWGLALALLVPSWVLLSRAVHAPDARGFQRAVLLGTGLRFLGGILGTLAFALLVPEASIETFLSFLLAFFLGYVLLTALELSLALRRPAQQEERA